MYSRHQICCHLGEQMIDSFLLPTKKGATQENGLNAIRRQQKPISARHRDLLCSLIKFFGIQWFCKHVVHIKLKVPLRMHKMCALRKHAYPNTLKILPPKNGNFSHKKSDIFHISAQNIYCGYSLELPRRGGSNEYPQSMFLSRNKKNNVYPCKPQFYYIKVGFERVRLI